MSRLSLYLPTAPHLKTQGFAANANPLYAGQGLKGHTSEDWGLSWGAPGYCLAKDSYCYSVMNKDNVDPMKYRAVFTLVPGDNGYSDLSEVSYGHCSDIFAEPGKTYQPDDVLYNAGNTGDVYGGNTYITREMKLAGSRAGTHLHGPQVRPVKRVKKLAKGKNYLTDANGKLKLDGYYFEVINYDNGYNGCINPVPFYNGLIAGITQEAPMKLELGEEGPHVNKFQEILKKLGFFPARTKTTQYYGPITAAAYEKFKKDTGLILSTPSTGTDSSGGATITSMNTSKFSFLSSPRFWQLALVGLATGLTFYESTGSWITALNAAVGIWFGGSVIVGTVDRAADKKVRAAEIASGNDTIWFDAGQ